MNFDQRLSVSVTAVFISMSFLACGSGGSVADRAVGEPDGGSSGTDGSREGGNTEGGVTNDTGKPRGAKQVFVTSSLYTGDSFGGVVLADSFCQGAASAAKLDGEFRAWLSTGDENAISHIRSNGPWHLLATQARVAASKSALASGSIESAISRDEFGEEIPTATECVWTGTTRDGTFGGTCNRWSSFSGYGTIGKASSIDSWWTDAEDVPCGQSCRLYCFEQ